MILIRKNLLVLTLCWSFLLSAQFNQSAPWAQNFKKRTNTGEKITFQEIQKSFYEYWKTHDPNKKGSGYKPFKRWEYIWKDAVDGEGYLPTSKDKWTAWENQAIEAKASVDLSNWSAIGPFTHSNTGSWSSGQARINAILVDPNNSNTWYVGAPSGGLWKSTDAGANWSPLTDNLPQIGVSGIAIDYANSNIIYIATGDDDASDTESAGVFKSTDGGATWSATGLNPDTTPSIMNEIYIHPSNSNILWVGTNEGLFKSIDAGATWTATLSGEIKDLKLKPGDPDVVYAVSPDEFYKSTDGGDTFTQITSGVPTGGGRMVIDVTPANASYVYIISANTDNSFQGVYRSTDSGSTFTARNTTTNVLESDQAWFDLAIGVSTTDADQIFVGCLNVWESSNGGTSFSKVNQWDAPASASYTHADIHTIRAFGNRLFVCSDGGIYSSTNNGTSFTDHTGGIQASQFYKIAVSPNDHDKMMGGLQDNGGHAYNSGNGNWLNYYGADGMDTAINPTNDNKYYGFTQNGSTLYISDNAGSSSSNSVSKPISATGNWVTPLAVNSAGNVFAGYNYIYRLRSAENGWTRLANLGTDSADLIEIAPSNDNIMLIGVKNILKKSTDAGSSVSDVHTFGGNIKGIAIHATNPDIVWVTTSTSVQRSDDGGSTFTNISSNLPVTDKYFFINDIVHQPGHTQDPIFIGTSIGVYRSVTGGSWTAFINNLPTTIVTDLEINTTENSITAGTYGRGIWRSSLPSCTTITADQEIAVDSGAYEPTNFYGLCTGQSVELKTTVTTGTSPTFSWTGPDGFTGSGSSAIINVSSLAKAGDYIVTINSTGTCGAIDYTFSLDIEEAIQPTTDDVVVCNNTTGTLTATGSTDYKWYDSPTAMTELATGASYTTPSLTANTTYYVSGLSRVLVSETVPSPGVGTATDYSFIQGLYFDTTDEITLESFTMSAMSAGDRIIQVSDNKGNVIASTTVTIPLGESLVTVNFDIPKGEQFLITIPNGLADIRRTPTGNGVVYPYTSPSGVVSITGNTANATDYYYFFYDWNFTSKGGRCESVRTPVNVTVNTDNPDLTDGDTTYAIADGGDTPFSDGDTILTAANVDFELKLPASLFSGTLLWTAPDGTTTYTDNTLSFTNIQDGGAVEGNWSVEVTFAPDCGTGNQTINFTVEIDPTLSTTDQTFTDISFVPNPVQDILTVRSGTNLQKAVIDIFEIRGRKLQQNLIRNQNANEIEINMSSLAKGAYFLRIQVGDQKVIKKIVKQ